MSAKHTPGPWRAGYWGGMCHVHDIGKHPGPPECKYTWTFWPMSCDSDGYVSFVGIVTDDPKAAPVVGTEYDELRISMPDATLLAAAPDYWDAAEAMKGLELSFPDDGDGLSFVAVPKAAYDALMAAHQKASGE